MSSRNEFCHSFFVIQTSNHFIFFPSPKGATIKADESTGRILIARVMHGGAADRSGLISVGDEVIEVNGINVEGKTPNDVLKILVSSVPTLINLSHRRNL